MESFKDGKYIIGFLVGVICSFVIMGGIKNFQGINEANLSNTQVPSENQIVDEGDGNGQTDVNGGVESILGGVDGKTDQGITKPEDPHSPELQRLALILRETEKMVERLKKDMRSAEIKQQTATILNQN